MSSLLLLGHLKMRAMLSGLSEALRAEICTEKLPTLKRHVCPQHRPHKGLVWQRRNNRTVLQDLLPLHPTLRVPAPQAKSRIGFHAAPQYRPPCSNFLTKIGRKERLRQKGSPAPPGVYKRNSPRLLLNTGCFFLTGPPLNLLSLGP